MRPLNLVIICLSSTLLSPCLATNHVEQVHLSLTGNMDEMMVTWLTQGPLPNVTPFVTYGLASNNLRWTGKAATTKWADGGKHGYVRYTHRAVMRNMLPGTKYYYTVGSEQATSKVFYFNQPDPSKPLRAAIFGDLSVNKGLSIDPLINATHTGYLDLVIHIGDIAYDLHDNEGDRGDDYMNAIEPMAAYIPYMVFPGNHETDQHFNHIINRFSMPKNGVYDNNLFWSFDYGITHFVALNTEYNAELLSKEAKAQYSWLEADLAKNKAKWTVVMFHRPMYCSTSSKKGCNDPVDSMSRKGNNEFPGWEKLLYDHKVDLVLYGHKHTYERMWPMYEGNPFKTKDPSHIKNPQAPIYMLTGAAGCHSHEGPHDSIPQDFSVSRLGNYGYTRLKIFNSTHFSTHFVDTSDKIGTFLDKMYVEKD